MAREDIIMLRQKELKRLHVIHRVLQGELKQVEAAELISLSERQLRTIVKRIQEEGKVSVTGVGGVNPAGRQFSWVIPVALVFKAPFKKYCPLRLNDLIKKILQ
jgi:hypothetical protein